MEVDKEFWKGCFNSSLFSFFHFFLQISYYFLHCLSFPIFLSFSYILNYFFNLTIPPVYLLSQTIYWRKWRESTFVYILYVQSISTFRSCLIAVSYWNKSTVFNYMFKHDAWSIQAIFPGIWNLDVIDFRKVCFWNE